MTEKEYRSHPAISRSDLWKIRESPEKFKWHMEHPAAPTEALAFGQLVHAMLLDSASLKRDFFVMPQLNLRTTADRAKRDELLRKANEDGQTIVTADQVNLAKAMTDKCLSDPDVVALLDGAHEQEFFWTDELTGEECKCRVDILTEVDGRVVIVDYKTTKNAMTHAFVRDLYSMGYHFQAGMYCTGVQKALGLDYLPRFMFIAQEKAAPYAINRIELPEDVIQLGVDKFREYIGTYHECKETGIWYGFNGPYGEANEAYILEWAKDGDDE